MSVSLFGSRSILGALQQVEQTQRGQGSQDASHLVTLKDRLAKSATQLNDKATALNAFKAAVQHATDGSAIALLRTVLSHMKPDALRHVNVAYNLSAPAGTGTGRLQLTDGARQVNVDVFATDEAEVDHYLAAHKLALAATAHLENPDPTQIGRLREAIFSALQNNSPAAGDAGTLPDLERQRADRSELLSFDDDVRHALSELGLADSIIIVGADEQGNETLAVSDVRTDPAAEMVASHNEQIDAFVKYRTTRNTNETTIAANTAIADTIAEQATRMASTLLSTPDQAHIQALRDAVLTVMHEANLGASPNNELCAGTVSFDPAVRQALNTLGLRGCILSADTDHSGNQKLTLTDISSELEIIRNAGAKGKWSTLFSPTSSFSITPKEVITNLCSIERNAYNKGIAIDKDKYHSKAGITSNGTGRLASFEFSAGSKKIKFAVRVSLGSDVPAGIRDAYRLNLQKQLISELQDQGVLNVGQHAQQAFMKISKAINNAVNQNMALPLPADAIQTLADQIKTEVDTLRALSQNKDDDGALRTHLVSSLTRGADGTVTKDVLRQISSHNLAGLDEAPNLSNGSAIEKRQIFAEGKRPDAQKKATEAVVELRSQLSTCFGGWRYPTREIDAGALAAALARAS